MAISNAALNELERVQGRTARFNAELAARDLEYCFNNKIKEDDFLKPPSRSALDDLAYFLVVGVDAKITPEGKVKIIELNGINSGVKGITVLERRIKGLKDPENEWIIDKFQDNKPARRVQALIDSYGLSQMAYVSNRLSRQGVTSYRLRGGSAITGAVNPDWLRYDDLSDRMAFFLKSFYEKRLVDSCFEQFRDYKTRTIPFSKELLPGLIESSKSGYVIFKPVNGHRGEGIMVSDSTKIIVPDNYLMEEFIPSKSIKSSVTGQNHDGCMRVLFFLEARKDGTTRTEYCGGYWRLAPLPIDRYGELDAMRANLAQGALPEQVNAEDLAAARKVAEEIVPRVCGELLKKRP